MFMARRGSEVSTNTCFYIKEICMQGFLRKSPPVELFANQSSWKKRYFMLGLLKSNAYSLKYFTPQNRQYKGEILLEDVKCLGYGIEDQDRMLAVQRMFKCSPEVVIFLATEKRDYYLLGDNKAQMLEWYNAISKVWMEVRSNAEPQACSTISCQTEEMRLRSTSCPVVNNSEAVHDINVGNFSHVQEKVHGAASRPHSDPIVCSGSTSPRCLPPQRYCSIQPAESKRWSGESTSTDEGVVYDVPNRYLKCLFCVDNDKAINETLRNLQCIHCSKKSNRDSSGSADVPQPDDSEGSEEEDENDPYERMDLVRQSFPPTYVNLDFTRTVAADAHHPDVNNECDGKAESGTTVPPLSSPGSEPNTNAEGDQTGSPLLRKTGSLERSGGKEKRRTPPLTHGRLLKLFSSRNQSEFKELDFFISKEAATASMGLLEVEDKICVSKWNGPESLGYPFHVGDHILAVNDIAAQSRDDVLKSISMARSNKVKITVLRVPISAILNTE